MNFLKPYYQAIQPGEFTISAAQGNAFAQKVAGDYNPIHEAESKRFCVPGDLLFAIAVQQYGIHQSMQFQFLDLVSGGATLKYPAKSHESQGDLTVVDGRDRPMLGVKYQGGNLADEQAIEQLLTGYVAFSGQNFPYILVPLMKEHNVMINPARPLVIYQSMSLSFETLAFENLQIVQTGATLTADGKRGQVILEFSLNDGDKQIGKGNKSIVLSGLREYNHEAITKVVDDYLAVKALVEKSH